VVEVAELFLAEQATREELEEAAQAAPLYEGQLAAIGIHIFACDAAAMLGCPDAWWAAFCVPENARIAIHQAPWMENEPRPEVHIEAAAAGEAEAEHQANLLREIVGNPFRPESQAGKPDLRS
jgi:hypothetical protein